MVAKPAMVSKARKHVSRKTYTFVGKRKPARNADEPRDGAQTQEISKNSYLQSIRKRLRNKGLSGKATNIVCSSWRKGTADQYDSYIKRWKTYACQRNIDPVNPDVEDAINFLAALFEQGLSCSAICIARSALSSFIDIKGCNSFGEHKLVKRLIKGVYELKPSFPKYTSTWDVDVVLAYLENLMPVEHLTIKEVSYKLVTLIAILSGQRCQTIHCLNIRDMTLTENKCVFKINSLLKQSKRGRHLMPIELIGFKENLSLCVIHTLREYLKRTKDKRKSEQLLYLLSLTRM